MPLFDFACKKCGDVFEHTRAFGNKENPMCPKCGSKRTEKLLSPPAIHFKGGGFYKTDSKTSAPKKVAPKEKPKEPKKEPLKAPPAPPSKKE